MLWVNFKTYQQGTGEKALLLAKTCWEVAKKTSIKIIPVVQVADIFRLTSEGFKVWGQHIDNISLGPNTGRILPEAILAAGGEGTILNHSENKVSLKTIGGVIRHCKELKLKTLVCSESIEEGKQISKFNPDYLVYEPTELIGTDISVSGAKPEIIEEFVRQIPGIPLVIGAGIHCREDIKRGLELGAKGFLVSSDVVLAENPKKELLELTGGYCEKI